MGFRFRRSIKILPGIRLNVGRRYASLSLSVRGAHVTVRAVIIGMVLFPCPDQGALLTHLESVKTRTMASFVSPRLS